MTSRLRVRTCGGGVSQVRPRPTDRLAVAPSDPRPPRVLTPDATLEKFGVIVFEGDPWQARQVVLAFDTRLEAAAYAADNQLTDYLIAPLSFLAPTGVSGV
jgi:hypothetical protein